MSGPFRLSLRILAPSTKCFVIRPTLAQINRASQQKQINAMCLANLKLNSINIFGSNGFGSAMHYSSKDYMPEIESNEEHIQLYSNIFKEQKNIQWREYSSNKMNKPNGKKAKLSVNPITKNLTYISSKPIFLEFDRKRLILQNAIDKPLCILFSYMLAKKKHLLKFAKVYVDLGFDVLLIETTPWQLLWPTKGSQLVAADALKFLHNNQDKFSPMIIHGFSVGGYQWGEVMALMSRDQAKYQPLLNKIRAQVWDSAADISEIPVGLPLAIFPKNQTLQAALRNYAIYHLKTFYQIATVHYARSSNFFHFPLLKSPCLFLVSEKDPVGSVKSNWSVKEDMESIGIKTSWQCWPDSSHVMHYLKHPEQYIELIYKHLRENNVLEDVAQKTSVAKL